jgi:3-deoxy-D-manno-octulosonic acid kinase
LLDFPEMDAPPASGSRIPFRDADGEGAIVFDPARLRQAGPSLFQAPAGDAAPKGRGHAWFVRGDFGAAVLKHYRRGGAAARLSAASYLWLGEARVRSIAEFALLRRLRLLGLPVPAPLAASYRRRGLSYRASLLVERIEPATAFAELVNAKGEAAPWSRVGTAIGRCHARGAHHADLNANNVLLDGAGAPWIIDWDKGQIEAGPGDWCAGVLDRLERSLRKECPGVATAVVAEGMRFLRIAHDRAVAT